MEVHAETEDDVSVRLVVRVHYFVLPEPTFGSFYKLHDAPRQMASFVLDVARAVIPRMALDDLLGRKRELAALLGDELEPTLGGFGIGLVETLVTEVAPYARAESAMSEVGVARRTRLVAREGEEAVRASKVKASEGEIRSTALQGRGIAVRRRGIVAGLRQSVGKLRKPVPGASEKEAMNLVLMTRYFDALKEIGASSRTSTLLIPHPNGDRGLP